MKYTLLVIDDERELLELLKEYFELEDFVVYTAANGIEALEKINCRPNLILLDINMPQMDGFTFCKEVRNKISCPILFLSARITKQDKIKGLMLGGDDYILKPFSMEELHARIIAHLRREERKEKEQKLYYQKDLCIDYSTRKVAAGQIEIVFTKTEFEIIELLSMHVDHIFTKEEIYEKVWGYEKEGDSTIMTEHIRRIRQKLAKESKESYIETVWGVGYRWIG